MRREGGSGRSGEGRRPGVLKGVVRVIKDVLRDWREEKVGKEHCWSLEGSPGVARGGVGEPSDGLSGGEGLGRS